MLLRRLRLVTRIEFDKAARDALVRMLTRQLKDECDLDIAPMDGQRLLDFISETLGPHYYNQGLYDAQAVLKDRSEAISEAIEGLARPTPR